MQTDVASVLVCGSGARRGGAVSGLGGHNAAQAVLGSPVTRSGPALDFSDPLPDVYRCGRFTTDAPLAQLAEQLTLNQRVGGSSP